MVGLRRYGAASQLAILAALLGLTSWGFVWPFRSTERLLFGYFCWQGSLLVLAISTARAAAIDRDLQSGVDPSPDLEAGSIPSSGEAR
jgi:hypothetical protein